MKMINYLSSNEFILTIDDKNKSNAYISFFHSYFKYNTLTNEQLMKARLRITFFYPTLKHNQEYRITDFS